MKVRNCLSLATGTQVSGEELYQFFYGHTAELDHNKRKEIMFYTWKNQENHWLDKKAMYEVTRVPRDSSCGSDTRIWFRRIQEEK
jgi:hypothetical protein